MIKAAKGLTELHRHLDVCTRTTTLLELTVVAGLEGQSTSLEAFSQKVLLKEPFQNLQAVLDAFGLFSKVLKTPKIIERIAFEAAEDCWKEGIRKVEFRFSPAFMTQHSRLDWEEVLQAIEAGLQRAKTYFPDLKTGLIVIISRDLGKEAAEKTAAFYLSHQKRLIGLDLAGPEDTYPCRDFESLFQPIRKAPGTHITVHAGESAGPEQIWEAIDLLGAQRIGHGVAYAQDPKLEQELAKRRICLEMCPTSNWLTRCVPSLEAHPLPRALRAGIPVCINTDDPGAFGITLPQELEVCRTRLGLTEAEIETCQVNARSHAFF